MKIVRSDLLLLRWPALILLAATAFMGLLVWASHSQLERLQTHASNAEREQTRARSELLEVRAQESNYRSFSSQFALLEQRGLTSAERRLDWIDMVQRLRARHKLYTLEYEISAQRNFLANLAPPSGMNPRGSGVSLQITTLHEGDLIGFLDELAQQSPGIFRQTRCDVARLPGDTTGERQSARLNARCEYDWLTLRASGS